MNDTDLPYLTLEKPGEAELVVERSRFLAWAMPVGSEEAALEKVSEAKSTHYDARHVCYGFRVGRGAALIDRANDDGEPARTAGLPIWQIIEGRELVDTLVYVVRYFGGIKLGTGGLARAYRESARMALDDATVVKRYPEARVTLVLGYENYGKFEHLVEELEGIRIKETVFGAQVEVHLGVRKVNAEAIRSRLAGFLQCAPEDVFG